MRKAQFLAHWRSLATDNPASLMPLPVPYGHTGSSYAEDGIRITGSQAWIDSVLARLTDLLAYESGTNRLQVNYQQSKDRGTGQLIDGWNCYVQVRERGPEAQMMNARFGRII